MELSRKRKFMSGALNATFLNLILKKEIPESFGDFRPIAICNSVYKLVTKIIALRLKSFLSERISIEQYGFVSNRQILEVIGVTQKCVHSTKLRCMKSLILKMDLSKAYDKVD